jgi:chromosome segregation ATPase
MGEHDNGGALNDEQRRALRDPTTEALRERNERESKAIDMLGKIWLLCGGKDGENAVQAAERLVLARNGKITELTTDLERARASLDIAHRKVEEYRKASEAVPTIAAEYKVAQAKLKAFHAEALQLRNRITHLLQQQDNWAIDRRGLEERICDLQVALAEIAIERVDLKRSYTHAAGIVDRDLPLLRMKINENEERLERAERELDSYRNDAPVKGDDTED